MTKNLVILSPGFAESETDLSCIPFLQMFVRELAGHKDLNIQIISFQYPFSENKYNWNGTDVHSIGGENKKGIQRIFTWIKVLRLLKKFRAENKIDLILSCWATECALIGSHFASRNNIKHICWIIGQDTKKENKYVKYIGKKTIYACKTPFMASYFEKNHGVRPRFIIPNGLNFSLLPKINKSEKTTDLIAVGSLIALKRFDWFILLISALVKKGLKPRCVLVGDGTERSDLEKQISENNLEKYIQLTGTISPNEVLEYLSQSKILIHPSVFEGFSTVTIEALFCSCHVITSCRPFAEENEQMHYFDNFDEMVFIAEKLLQQKELLAESQLNYTTQKSVDEFLKSAFQ